jgi:hypothetical protein
MAKLTHLVYAERLKHTQTPTINTVNDPRSRVLVTTLARQGDRYMAKLFTRFSAALVFNSGGDCHD